MKWKLWINLRSVTQFLLGTAAPFHDQAPFTQSMWGRHPLMEQEARWGLGKWPHSCPQTPAQNSRLCCSYSLPKPVGWIWMFSAQSMEVSCRHTGFGSKHHRKCSAYKVNYRVNRETVAHRTHFIYSELLKLSWWCGRKDLDFLGTVPLTGWLSGQPASRAVSLSKRNYTGSGMETVIFKLAHRMFHRTHMLTVLAAGTSSILEVESRQHRQSLGRAHQLTPHHQKVQVLDIFLPRSSSLTQFENVSDLQGTHLGIGGRRASDGTLLTHLNVK